WDAKERADLSDPQRAYARQPVDAVDQHRRNARPSGSDGVAFDPQRGRGRRAGRRDSDENVPRRGPGCRGDPEEPRALRALSDRGGRRSARAEGSQAIAHIECRAGAVHPRALRAHLSVDAGMGAGRAGRHLRKHGGQPRLAVVKFPDKSMTKLDFGRKARPADLSGLWFMTLPWSEWRIGSIACLN